MFLGTLYDAVMSFEHAVVTKLLLVTCVYTFSKETVQIFRIKDAEWKDVLELKKKSQGVGNVNSQSS